MTENSDYLELYKTYQAYCECINKINKKVSKKIRKPNFPEAISEYIARLFIKDSVQKKTGDLWVDNKRVEIKCFSSHGPTSFGPTEAWSDIIFIDAIHHPKIKIYWNNNSRDSKEWQDLKVSKTETMRDQSKKGRRPRICFDKIQEQIKLTLITESNITDILEKKVDIKTFCIREMSGNKKIRIADFFCGVGGIRLGFETCSDRYKCVFSNDIDEFAIKTYETNFPNHEVVSDSISDLEDIPDFDLFTGGFPCQSFSQSGNKKGFEDPRGNLFFEIVRILKDKKPKAFLLENVKNLKTHDNGKIFKRIQDELKESGYFFKDLVMNTTEYGNIPQNRERIYIVGFLDSKKAEKFTFPEKIPLETRIVDCLEDNVSEKYFYTEKSSIFEKLKEEVVVDVEEDQVYQYRRSLVRANKSGVVPTLMANMGTGGHNVGIILENNKIRKLTPRECFNLQGFPSDYILPKISDSQLYKQVGNTVSVPVVRRIAEEMLKVL